MAYVREHAQEMEESVIRSHLELYVNDFTEDLGDQGRRAVEALLAMAEARGIVPGAAGG
jgi:1,4-dihydroxy-6-naphthoate synthase